MKINTKQELLKIIRTNVHIYIIGTGWISKLVACFADKYVHKDLERFIFRGGIDKEVGEKELFIIAEQEEKGRAITEELSNIYPNKMFYLSNDVKNEIDSLFMADYPEIYEEDILLSRKEELDKDMQDKFLGQIKNLLEMPQFPVFQEIEIETINRCNGTCSFCPINKTDDSRPYAKMEDSLFESIILQLHTMKYQGRVGLYSNNEPLLDKRTIKFAHLIKDKLPDACKIMYTNGTLLTKNTFAELMECLDILCLDLYYDDKADEIFSDNILKVLEYGFVHEDLQEKIMIQVIGRRSIRNNRGGQSKNRKKTYQVKATCMLPFIQMVVRPDGSLSLCCNDALGKNTLGNLKQENVLEAWNNFKYREIREKILQGRQNMPFCKYCDNYATTNTKGNEEFSKEEMKSSWNMMKKILGKY